MEAKLGALIDAVLVCPERTGHFVVLKDDQHVATVHSKKSATDAPSDDVDGVAVLARCLRADAIFAAVRAIPPVSDQPNQVCAVWGFAVLRGGVFAQTFVAYRPGVGGRGMVLEEETAALNARYEVADGDDARLAHGLGQAVEKDAHRAVTVAVAEAVAALELLALEVSFEQEPALPVLSPRWSKRIGEVMADGAPARQLTTNQPPALEPPA